MFAPGAFTRLKGFVFRISGRKPSTPPFYGQPRAAARPPVVLLLLLGASLLPLQSASAANRIFDLNVKNGTPDLQYLYLQGGSCYEGDGFNNPGKLLFFPALAPGDSFTVTLARVQTNDCSGKQGYFTLRASAYPNLTDISPLNFDNGGNLALGDSLPNRYHAVLSEKNPVNESYTWTMLPASQRLAQPVDQRLTRPRNPITTNTGSWEHKNGSTLRRERFLFANNGYFGNHYEKCFGNPFFHPQHVQRLANKDGKAYFMITNSLSHNGNMYLVETFDGVLNEATGRLDPSSGGGFVGQIIWEEVFTGDFNGSINPIGNWNHPGKMTLIDGVLIMAAQNWSEGMAADACSGSTSNPYQRGSSEDAALFFDVRDPSAPKYWGKMTASELQVPESRTGNGGAITIFDRMISVVALWRTAEGKYALNVGGQRGAPHYATWEADYISPNIENWVKRNSIEYTSGEYGDDFETYQATNTGLPSAPVFTDGRLRNVAFAMTNAGAGGGTNDGFQFRTISSEVADPFDVQWNLGLNDDDTWIASSHHATREGAPLFYTVQNSPGPLPELWQVYDVRNDLPLPFPPRVVENLNDSGPGSLREAIGYGGKITFSSALNGGTIRLTSGPLIVNLYDVDINALEDLPQGLIISAEYNSRVLHVTPGNHASLTGITILHGVARSERLAPGIASNHSSLGGGGILNEGSMLLSQSTVMENYSEKDGGGIYNTGSLEMHNSTIAGNYAAALYSNAGIQDSGQSGGGGGISNVGEALLIHTTVAHNNDLGRGVGGIMTRGGGLFIDNSIVAANSPTYNGNLSGVYSALGANILNSASGASLASGPAPIEVPILYLKALGYYGGNTPTMPPSDEDSPAVDAAKNTIFTVKIDAKDQNGLLRPSGNAFDIGAVELPGSMVFVSPSAVRIFGGSSFSYQIAVSGNIATSYTATGLPSGLSLNTTTGVISGTTFASGTYDVKLTARNAGETVDSDLLLAVNPPSFTVSTTADSGAGSLRALIAAAPEGSTITFAAELGGQAIVLTSGTIVISKFLFIDASGLANGVVLDGNGESQVLSTGPLEVSIDSLTITGGASNGVGGGIRNNGVLNLTNSTLHNNSASFGGGGVSSIGTLRIRNSTFFNNRSPGYGDASSGFGGAVYVSGRFELIHSTLASNEAQEGGAIALSGVVARLENAIVAGNSALVHADIADISGDDKDAAITVLGRNLIGSNSSVESSLPAGALIGTAGTPLNPMLPAPGNYGGPTATIPPLSGSPAIDGAILLGSTPLTDQQGKTRPAGAHPDLGAVEVGGALDGSISTVNGVLKSVKKLQKKSAIKKHGKSAKALKKARKHLEKAIKYLQANEQASGFSEINKAIADLKKVSKARGSARKYIKKLGKA